MAEKQFQYFTLGSDDEARQPNLTPCIQNMLWSMSILLALRHVEVSKANKVRQAAKQGAQGIPRLDGVWVWERNL